MKRKLIRILAGACAFLLIVLLVWITNSLVGNPLSAHLATGRIRSYVAQTYPGDSFTVEKAKYNFKFQEYFCIVSSPTSADTVFSVSLRKNRIEDNYESEVQNRFTTFRRLSDLLDQQVEDVVKRDFPYEIDMVIGSFAGDGDSADLHRRLTLDMPLDPRNPPLPVEVTVYTYAEERSYKVLAQRLRELHAILEKSPIEVSFYSLNLVPPRDPDGSSTLRWESALYLTRFPAEKISSPDLPELIQEHQQEWELQNQKKDERKLQ